MSVPEQLSDVNMYKVKPARPDKSVISPLHRLNPPVTAAPQTQVSSSQEV
ncbi:hypothetical protein PoMZ_04058 [Pyricularia oryzae]|uniref:Uncharacterized protein n=1 Tax=Pyricularia oryzae TaxID=318829 RepID=A0A4P7N8U4_PYROR|nr:hypothetical protein PoMZ_04058 [Pyricularia oryzae]